MSFNDSNSEVVIKGTSAAVKTPDNGWQSAMFIAHLAQNYKTPAAEAASLAAQVKELKAGTNGISGELSEDGAKGPLTFRSGSNGGGPTVPSPKDTVVFWLTNGKLSKYQHHVTGTVTFNDNDREVDRTTTTEIKEVNTTKIEVPGDAKKKLE